MNIEITQLASGNYYVDILELPGSPHIGKAETKAFTRNITTISQLPRDVLIEVNIIRKIGATGNTAPC